MSKYNRPTPPGLPGDPTLFSVMTEIDMIAHMAMITFERSLPDKLTKAQFGVLNHLLRLGVEETIGELAAAFQVAQPTMSSTVKRLVNKGFVEFILDKDDRRIKRVRVTPAGIGSRQKAIESIAPYLIVLEKGVPDIDWAKPLAALTSLRAFFEQYQDDEKNLEP